jgi:hypothetical protein
MRSPSIAWVVVQFILGAHVAGQEATTAALTPLPQGDSGIASKYPGDAGIEKDAAVIFHEDFETCSKPADLNRTWNGGVFGEHSLRITEEPANVHGGKKALEIAMPQQTTPQSSGMQKVFKDEYDVVFLRFYSKFEKGFDYPLNTSCHNGADISAHYYTHGATPGQRADGHNKFLVAFEDEVGYRDKAPLPGPLNFYVYHPEQREPYGDHFFPSGRVMPFSPQLGNKGNFGKDFVVRPEVVPELDRWYCFEYMVKANTPGQRDGRIACWLDGKLLADLPNLRFRDVATLKIERIGIGIYMANNALRVNKKWYDDVVAATSYIGPLVTAKKAQTGPAGGSSKLPPFIP